MFTETRTIWEYLKSAEKPIVMYGMGNGAEKILKVLDSYGIRPNAFMASDDFVRGHSFQGFSVNKLSEIEGMYDDFIILVCFGTSRDDIINKIYGLAEKYEVYAPDVPVIGDGLFDETYVAKNIKKIVAVREILADDVSKYVFDRLIDFRISGKIEHLQNCTTPLDEALDLFNIRHDSTETFVDLGAYDGDTVAMFLERTKKSFNRIYAVEPDSRNFIKIRRRNYALGSAKFIPINAAVWDEDAEIDFSDLSGRGSRAGRGRRERKITARSVDSICAGCEPTIIKMDVEGCEERALLGASQTINKCLPRLIVSLYHRNADMLELPLLVYRLSGGAYSMYLRHHNYIPAWDTNLYCVKI
ncbi:MAG: FkbM family methyltransferase [Eubacterium sp.]|jgi:FkbM family methyltransferase|nr:FkbM family methyltransferase [Eubacterium sp.]